MNSIAFNFKKFIIPARFWYIKKYQNKKKLFVLDVGCGSRSSELTRMWLDVAQYDGVDKGFWHNDSDSYKGIDNLFFLDLDESQLDEIKNCYYDLIILSHVIEHTIYGVNIILLLLKKLKPGGLIYIETPSLKTINFPSADGFLNFYDDDSHKRLYFDSDIIKVLQDNDFVVRYCGFRRHWVRILFLSPLAIFLNIFYFIPLKSRLCSWGLWDILGVARVWIGQKR